MLHENEAMDIPQFCARFRVSRSKLYDEISTGRLRAVKIGRRTVILASDAAEWLAALPAAKIGKRAA